MNHFFAVALLTLIAAGWVYWIGAWWCVRRYFVRPLSDVDRGLPPGDAFSTPSVSILKPVKGLDAGAWENFASFCQQDYPDFEILFGVAEASDPVVGLIRRLQQVYPQVPIRLLIGADKGANPKAALLSRLESQARRDVLVVCDSDIRVDKNYLKAVCRSPGRSAGGTRDLSLPGHHRGKFAGTA